MRGFAIKFPFLPTTSATISALQFQYLRLNLAGGVRENITLFSVFFLPGAPNNLRAKLQLAVITFSLVLTWMLSKN